MKKKSLRVWDEFKENYPPDRWRIDQIDWQPPLLKMRETQFAQGNGYFCCRGVLDEVPYDSTPGTYIAGLFDRTGAQITELVNCPNPINMRIDASGEKLDVVAMDVLKHERNLDMRDGVLNRQTLLRTAHKKRVLLQSRRMISMHNKHVGVMEVHVTPLDSDMTFNIQTTIDTSVSNRGVLTEGRKIHFAPYEVSHKNDLTYLCVRTFENETLIAYATSLEICKKSRCHLVANRALKQRAKKGQTITIRKFFTLFTSMEVKPHLIKKKTIGELRKVRRQGLKRLFEEHQHAWSKKWKNANVDIVGDQYADQALRFNIYHLVIAGNEENDNVSIGARTLSSEGYRGHVFWDAELFITPVFMFTFPKAARNQLMYRYHRLDAARENAKEKGYKGALYPWESADTGEECTPSWTKDLNGNIVQITTLDYEHHIVADIAYAVDQYVRATGDLNFMWHYGSEILIETARFWADRVTYNKQCKRYEIHDAMGPDEFHDKVSNSVFTNMMAKWNLQRACEGYWRSKEKFKKRMKALERRLRLTEREVKNWQKIASKMYIPYNKTKNLIEQFDGYFKLRDPRITQLDEHFMPVLPASVDSNAIYETQLIKQADVVMLLFLFGDQFSMKEKKKNYYYYEKRTMHKSSLSPIIHSIVGLEVGDYDKALHYFAHALATDLHDIHGNTDEGIHAASAGGAWQAITMGFAGMRLHDDHISFSPRLPPHWKDLKFAVWYRGGRLRVSIKHNKTDIVLEHIPKGKIFASVYGVKKQLKKYEFVTFEPQGIEKKKAEKKTRGHR